jgi:antitoxin component of MazEF toxin-antitoxin module
MGYPTKVQLIERKDSQQFYINLPAPIAQAMGFTKGELVEWTVADKQHLILARSVVPADAVDVKKKLRSV